MVYKFRTANNIMQTDIADYVVLCLASKIEIFDLRKREIVAKISVRYADIFCIMHKKFVANSAGENNCVIDLQKMEIVKKFNAYSIIKKHLLESKHKSERFHVEPMGSEIIEITDDKLLCKVMYSITDYDAKEASEKYLSEKYTYICEFDTVDWKLLRHYGVPNNYVHKIAEKKLPFLHDDSATVAMFGEKVLPINGGKYDRVFFYNSAYNVVGYRGNGICCLKYLDDSESDATSTPISKKSAELLAKSKEPDFDVQDHIRKNGLTREVLDIFSEAEILDGGHFWALDKLNKWAAQEGQSPTKYLENHKLPEIENILYSIGWLETEIESDGFFNFITGDNAAEFDRMIEALNLVGAGETAKVLEKGKKLMLSFHELQEKPLEVYRSFEEKSLKIEEELDAEDYVDMAINYIRNKQSKFD